MDSKRLGKFGENIACYYLESKGYRILDKNYFKKWSGTSKGEIDIVSKKDKTIVFVEVKTLRQTQTEACFNPEDRIDFRKQKQLLKLAQIWLSEKEMPLDSNWRIDGISVRADLNSKKAKIRHFENI